MNFGKSVEPWKEELMRTVVVLSVVITALSGLWASDEVARVEYRNPIAGFALTIPADWEVSTGVTGNVEIAIDAPSVSVASYPALEFFYAPGSPEQVARGLGALLQAAASATPPVIRPTGNKDEWEMTTTMKNDLLGPVDSRWLCRRDRGATYVIGAMVRPQFASLFQSDINLAFSSCHLIRRPIIGVFLEPTEHAYRIIVPYGWSWVPEEGKIIRTMTDPGTPTWKVKRKDGLAGCFVAPAVAFDFTTPYPFARGAAEGMVLQELRKAIPDLQVTSHKPYPRSIDHFMQLMKAVMPSMNPRIDKVRTDYRGTLNGVPVQVRVTIVTFQPDQSPLFAGGGNWFLQASGIWAPVQEFDAVAPVAAGTLSSFRLDPAWKRRMQNVVSDVLRNRQGAFDQANEDWDLYIRGTKMVTDPNTGQPREAPDEGPGTTYVDTDGKIQTVGPGDKPGEGWKEAPPVKK